MAQVSVTSTDIYSDALKLSTVNAWLPTLPANAWAIFVDSDELVSFPCDFERELRLGKDRFCAEMYDRLSGSGGIDPVREYPDISVQFPSECMLRQLLGEDWDAAANEALLTSATRDYVAALQEAGPVSLTAAKNLYWASHFDVVDGDTAELQYGLIHFRAQQVLEIFQRTSVAMGDPSTAPRAFSTPSLAT